MRVASRRLLNEALEEYQNEGDDSGFGECCYRCNMDKLLPELASCFVQLHPDEETHAFLQESRKNSNNICLQFLYILVQIFLGPFISHTAINGLLERGRMFIFSQQHLQHLLPLTHPTLILDIGAGDGHVTEKLSSLGGRVHVTERSKVMQRVLKKKGYHVLHAENWHTEPYSYDIISCLNVLDRCDSPLTMLRDMYNKLQPGGLLILALVLPYKPFVERGPQHRNPSELLAMEGEEWEEGVCTLWTNVLKPLGFTPTAITRLPYLCEGDLHEEFYYLDDAVIVLKKTV